MTILETINEGNKILSNVNIEDAMKESKLLMQYILKIDYTNLLVSYNDEIDERDKKEFFKVIKKRKKGMPLNYITGTKEFMNLTFKVNKNVLIPRGDTEVLVRATIEELEKYNNDIRKNDDDVRILDMCTGSGAIALSLARYFNKAKVMGSDISKKALKVANENKDINHIKNAMFVHSNLFELFKKNKLEYSNMFDMIISNPPYIKDELKKTLDKEVVKYEPNIALFGGSDGLDFYKKIMHDAKDYLMPYGILAFEIDYTYEEVLTQLLKNEGYTSIRMERDVENRPRVLIARKDIEKNI